MQLLSFFFDDSALTTPFELVHKVKPNLRVLSKMFGLAAVRRERTGDTSLNKFESQSIPMIVIGQCPNSNGLQFYNPLNGTIVSSIDYKFQPNVTSGARFGYHYQPGTFIYRLDESTSVFAPKFALDTHVLVHTHSPPHIAKIIGIPNYDHPDIYTVVFNDGSISEYSDTILEATDPPSLTTSVTTLPSWIQGGANAMLFLSDMAKPYDGKLYQSSDNQWRLCPGKLYDPKRSINLI